MARRVKDDEYVLMPNQLGIDRFDFKDAFGKQKEYMCSADLKEFVKKHHLNRNQDDKFNPRLAFGSASDQDHVYNTPRAWYIARHFNPRTCRWDGPDADYTPESNDIPWSFVPEHKITPEDVKYILSSYYQGTKYNPYAKADYPEKGIYRPIGISRTGVMAILQIRGYMPEELQGIEWICFGANPFNTVLPVYANVDKMPKYLSDVTLDVSTENYYWGSRLLGALADPNYGTSIQFIERYQNAVPAKGRALVNEYDRRFMETPDPALLKEANEKLSAMAKKETTETLNKVLLDASKNMRCGYSRADN